MIRNQNLEGAKAAPIGWSGSLSFNSEKTLDEFERPYWGLGAEIAYQPRPTTTFEARLGFQSPYAAEDADPALVQGVDDLGVDWVEKKIWTHDVMGSLSSKVGFELPTSELSRRQTLNIATRYGLSLATPLQGMLSRITIITGLGMYISSYKFDYADELGTAFNSPFGSSEVLGAALNIGGGVTWTNTFRVAQRYDYGGVWTPSQRYISALAYQATKQIAFSASYTWADRVFSNDPSFTARKSSLTGEMSYEF